MSKRIATTALAPRLRASSIIRPITSLRLFTRLDGHALELAADHRLEAGTHLRERVAGADGQAEHLSADLPDLPPGDVVAGHHQHVVPPWLRRPWRPRPRAQGQRRGAEQGSRGGRSLPGRPGRRVRPSGRGTPARPSPARSARRPRTVPVLLGRTARGLGVQVDQRRVLGRRRAPSASSRAVTRSCCSRGTYCHITLCQSTVTVPGSRVSRLDVRRRVLAPLRRYGVCCGEGESPRPAARDGRSWSGQTYAVSVSRPSVGASRRPGCTSQPPSLDDVGNDRDGRRPSPVQAGSSTTGLQSSAPASPRGRRSGTGRPGGSGRRWRRSRHSRTGSGRPAASASSPPISAAARPTSLVWGGRSSHARTASGRRPRPARKAGRGLAAARPGAAHASGSTPRAHRRRSARARAGARCRPAAARAPDGPGVVLVPAAAPSAVGPPASRSSASRARSSSAYIGEPRRRARAAWSRKAAIGLRAQPLSR